jgi:hypothetical protein
MKIDFLDDATKVAAPLVVSGFEVSESGYSEKYFGNGWLLLQKAEVRVRIVLAFAKERFGVQE